MLFRDTELAGVVTVEPEKREDERGFFARLWCRREFEEHGLDADLAQASLSYNRCKGTVRGMHFQTPPHEEAKLVRVQRGALWDVVLDLRPASPTFGRWQGFELTAGNRRALFIPKGVAHGFQTLEDETEMHYQISAFHAPESAAGVRWDDPAFGIAWPLPVSVISERDRSWPDFALAARRELAGSPIR